MADIKKFRGALLGGACGDALGYPLQNFSVARIQHRFGPFGLRTLVRDVKNGRKAPVTDNTQMVLAAIDGILWADAKKLDVLDGIYRGFMRWYYSQTGEEPKRGQRTWMRRQPHEREFCLLREKFMHARRNPEDGVLSAFSKDFRGSVRVKINDSKGAASLSRAVPVGLLYTGDSKTAFDQAVKAAALSHSNPLSYYSAGALAVIISCISDGWTLPKALQRAEELLGKLHKTDPIISLLSAAEAQANNRPAGKSGTWDHIDSISSLGSGREANEALAIAVYACLALDDPTDALIISANHGGRSNTTAFVTGAIEGARFGEAFMPRYWADILEGAEPIGFMADRLFYVYGKYHK
ncbi:ADP-ribosylglycohydrolase family protein [Dialister sp.]|uniref:ADP-ribosylglycohydrolase family protein n=1 Tax=Dialister sp. TaxID=1955814 RepID=UPI002E80C5B8|nr:ADP-ribosylglycohydrolase family protein [Dialister sp.]MEE3453118.1 ADP-ribosylglycohydrolase family protein [Dialister sp.]